MFYIVHCIIRGKFNDENKFKRSFVNNHLLFMDDQIMKIGGKLKEKEEMFLVKIKPSLENNTRLCWISLSAYPGSDGWRAPVAGWWICPAPRSGS